MKLSNLVKAFAPLLLLTSCSDDIKVNPDKPVTDSGLTILIPSMGEFTTRAIAPLEGDEGNFQNLDLFIFKDDGSFYKHESLANVTHETENGYDKYLISGVEKGQYHFFMTANIQDYLNEDTEAGDYIDLTSTSLTKSNLEEAILHFSTTRMLTADNLPMACLSTEIEEANKSTGLVEIKDPDQAVHAPLTFLCSKVRLTVLFNSEENGISNEFGDKSFDITLTGDNAPYLSYLSELTQVKYNSNTNIPVQKESDNTTISAWPLTLTRYQYPSNGDSYPVYNQSEGRPEENLTAEWDESTGNKKQKAWQGIIYVPENLTSTPTKINLSSRTEGNTQELQHSLDITTTENGSTTGTKRGGFYDVRVKVQNYNATDWKPEISIYDWQQTVLPVDFVHTYLEVERTTAEVTSIYDDVITYSTDGRGGIGLQCINPDNLTIKGVKVTTPVIVLDNVDETNHTLTLSANSDINVKDLDEGALIGTAICYITAGNIKKQIIVKYDLEAFFNITPVSITFNMNDKEEGKALASQRFEFDTNLGGIKLYKTNEAGNNATEITSSLVTGYTDNVTLVNVAGGDEETSTIKLTCSNTSTNKGYITVSVDNNWKCTHVSHHYFKAEPVTNDFQDKDFSQIIMVSVIPSEGNYRVYFRAINDYQKEENSYGLYADVFLSDDWSKFPTEDINKGTNLNYESNNWIDWWDNSGSSNKIEKNYHNIYIYGQIGETGSDFSNLGSDYGENWAYNDYDRGDPMDGDYTNPGWYYRDLAPKKEGYPKDITPGSTLFIFHNRANAEALHRCSHHNDPGVPLFNYEDREGWYLYDPTREPYYTVYDEKPVIEDVIYEIYTPFRPLNWFRNYGVSAGNSSYDAHHVFKIYGNLHDGEGLGKVNQIGNYYVTQLKFKAPQGDYAKNIILPGKGDGGKHYIFVCDQTGWAYLTPRIHMWNNSKGDYKPWGQGPLMKRISSPTGYDGDKPWWMFEVPAGWEQSYIKIVQNENLENQWNNSKLFDINNETLILYLDSNRTNNWQYYSEKYFMLTIFGGQSFTPVTENGNKIIRGYYKDGKWYKGRP